MTVVFAHRHNKKDVYITETTDKMEGDSSETDLYFDFSIMRNAMYQYSKRAQQVYFEHPIECFFMAQFASTKDGMTFITQKPDKSLNKEKT